MSFDGLWWGDLFMNFKETRCSNQNLRLYQERLFPFLAPIVSTCIITSSLIHEVTTLMEKLFKFWERYLSVQIAYLIKKGFWKHVMQAMVHGYEKKGNSQAQKCVWGFQRPRININYSSILFLLLSL
jgi:hypothetical protein